MSLSSGRVRYLKAAVVLGAALALGGCFQPMYAGGTMSGGLAPANAGPAGANLAAIDVLPVEGRVGQQVRNQLIFVLTGGTTAPPPRYRLDVTTSVIAAQTAVVDPYTDRPEVETAGVDAAFTLVQVGSGTPVFTGKAFGRATYTRTRQRFASERARRDAEDRAARIVAEQIRAQLQGHFAKGS
jgi:LPS-assembly lipoprotein